MAWRSSLIFGILVSSLLTLVVIPVLLRALSQTAPKLLNKGLIAILQVFIQ